MPGPQAAAGQPATLFRETDDPDFMPAGAPPRGCPYTNKSKGFDTLPCIARDAGRLQQSLLPPLAAPATFLRRLQRWWYHRYSVARCKSHFVTGMWTLNSGMQTLISNDRWQASDARHPELHVQYGKRTRSL